MAATEGTRNGGEGRCQTAFWCDRGDSESIELCKRPCSDPCSEQKPSAFLIRQLRVPAPFQPLCRSGARVLFARSRVEVGGSGLTIVPTLLTFDEPRDSVGLL